MGIDNRTANNFIVKVEGMNMTREILKLSVCVLFLLVNSQVGAEEITFSPKQEYKGDLFVVVDPGQWGCKDVRERKGYATARIIWGPWQTKEVELSSTRPVAIIFKKKNKRESIPLTVIVNGCDRPTIELKYGKPERGKYLIKEPDWERR